MMRYIYVMRHDIGLNSYYKIGISDKAMRRWNEVNRTYRVKLIFFFLLFDAEQKEAALHKRYKRYHVKNVPKHVSGRTEFFDINFLQVFLLRWEIALISFTQLCALPMLIALLLYFWLVELV